MLNFGFKSDSDPPISGINELDIVFIHSDGATAYELVVGSTSSNKRLVVNIARYDADAHGDSLTYLTDAVHHIEKVCANYIGKNAGLLSLDAIRKLIKASGVNSLNNIAKIMKKRIEDERLWQDCIDYKSKKGESLLSGILTPAERDLINANIKWNNCLKYAGLDDEDPDVVAGDFSDDFEVNLDSIFIDDQVKINEG